MTDTPYSNREIEQMHDSLIRQMKDHNKIMMEKLNSMERDGIETKVEAKKTNGRVSSLENWKWFITGAVGIIGMMVIPLVVFIYTAGL